MALAFIVLVFVACIILGAHMIIADALLDRRMRREDEAREIERRKRYEAARAANAHLTYFEFRRAYIGR